MFKQIEQAKDTSYELVQKMRSTLWEKLNASSSNWFK